jgi:hypothetical protein
MNEDMFLFLTELLALVNENLLMFDLERWNVGMMGFTILEILFHYSILPIFHCLFQHKRLFLLHLAHSFSKGKNIQKIPTSNHIFPLFTTLLITFWPTAAKRG